jgi:hypothetical protein
MVLWADAGRVRMSVVPASTTAVPAMALHKKLRRAGSVSLSWRVSSLEPQPQRQAVPTAWAEMCVDFIYASLSQAENEVNGKSALFSSSQIGWQNATDPR